MCRQTQFLLVLLFFWAISISQAADNDELQRYRWDLTPLYTNETQWKAERDNVMQGIQSIGSWKGKLGASAKSLADGLDSISDLRARAGKLAIFGFLRSDRDSKSEVSKEYYEVGTALESQVESAVSFLAPEVRQIGEARLHGWLEEEPRLRRYEARIERILVEAPYAIDTEAQSVLESAGGWQRTTADLFWTLHGSDLGWPSANETSHSSKLDRAAYLNLKNGKESSERMSQMLSYLNSLTRLQDVFALLYTRRIQADLIFAKHRRFQEGMDAAWFLRDGMPPGSYRIMIDTTRQNMKLLHRFAKVRTQLSASKRAGYDSLSVQPPFADQNFPIAFATQTALAASKSIGEPYLSRLRERLQKPWMDLAPAPEKAGTYAIWPPVGGIPPYVFMNYKDNYDSARRFVGAITLMMTFAEWGIANAPDTRDDPGIFSNGMIYVGDILFDDYMLAHAKSKDEELAYLTYALDFLRSQYVQWVLNSEFDARVEELLIQGEVPSGRRLSELYLSLLKEYYGVEVEEPFGNEWMLNSVPFLSYEHQFWPPAVAAACKIVEGLYRNEAASRSVVFQILGRNKTDRTYGLLMQSGIDMNSPAPYLAVFNRMERLLSKLESSINR